MNKKHIEYIKKHNAKIAEKAKAIKKEALFAKSQNVKWIYENVPSLRKRIEREG
tara:strand:+ start:315 stop:476 length:162 start_codon:yes stop_codon:yes gene_type:complete